MNKEWFGYIVVIIIVFFLFFLIWKSQSDKETIADKISSDNKIKQEVKQLTKELKEARQLGQDEKASQLEQEIEGYFPEKFKKALEIAKKGDFSIDFYGKVVDQKNEPVANAEIKYSTMGLWNLTKGDKGKVVTDNKGVFNINAKGNKLFLRMPEHKDVAEAFAPNVNESLSHEPVKVLEFIAGKGVHGNSEGWEEYSKESPYIINVWTVESFDDVINYKGNYGITPNGQSHTFIRNNKKNIMYSKIGKDSEGYIYMTCERDSNGYSKRKGDWSITLQAVDGGVQETNDFYLNEAPLTGYQSAIIISMDENMENYKSRVHGKKYYFTAHNEQVYGSIVVAYEPFRKKRKCLVNIDYKINLNGSRNLAVKKQ